METADAEGARWRGTSGSAMRPLDKMVTEAALLAYLGDRVAPGDPGAADLARAVAARDDVLSRTYELLRWRPHLRTSIGLLWLVLDHFDEGDTVKRTRLRELWEREPEPPQPHERVPYRLLDQAWVRSLVHGRVDPLLLSPQLTACTSLGNTSGGLFMHRDDLYALTHAAMYVSDFGRAGPSPGDPEWVDALGLSRLLAGDLDLAGELAIARLLMERRQEAVGVDVITAMLDTVFDDLGYVPSPTFDSLAFEQAGGSAEYRCYHAYHTTFVYGILCAVALQQDWDLTTRGATEATDPGYPSVPSGWEGGDAAVPVSDRVMTTLNAWTDVCADRDAVVSASCLLRGVIDAYLVQAVQKDEVTDLLQLLGMAQVAGPSCVDEAARSLVATRTHLSGASAGRVGGT